MPTPHSLTQLPSLTDEQSEIITGSLLGDASLQHSGIPTQNFKFSKNQSRFDIRGIDKIDYLEWHRNKLLPYSNYKIRPVTYVNKIINNKDRTITMVHCENSYSGGYVFTTHCHPVFTEMAKLWYLRDKDGNYVIRNKKKVKIIPHSLKLTPLTLCVWHMDDGSACAADANLTLHTEGFTFDECQFLVDRLKIDLGIQSHVKPREDKFAIYVGRKSYFDFIDMIRPYVRWKCFQYKLDTTTYCKKPHRGETHSLAKLTEEDVKNIIVMAMNGVPQKEIAKKFNLNKSSVSLIISGKQWSHIDVKRPTIKKKSRLTKEQKEKILSMRGQKHEEIARELGISQPTVSRTLNYKNVTILK